MDAIYKIRRVRRWGSAFGYVNALLFELNWSRRKPLVGITMPGYEQPLWLRRKSSDLSVFETVFLRREFEIYLPESPRLIIDGGANVGYSTAFCAKRFPRALIAAVEPSGANLAMLRANCKAFPNVRVIEGGLWPHSCRLRIANPHDPAWSFRCEPATADASDGFPAYSIDDVIDRSGHDRCDLLKLDVEGAEEHLFAPKMPWLSRVDAILVEIHGPRAMAAVQDTCRSDDWSQTTCGEKLLLVSRSRNPSTHRRDTHQ